MAVLRPLCGFILIFQAKVAIRAKGLVFNVRLIVDGHLLAFENKSAVDLAAVERCFAAAGADGLHLLNAVSQQEEPLCALKAIGGKVRPQAIGNDRNLQANRHRQQFIHLRRFQELRFIYQNAVDGLGLQPFFYDFKQPVGALYHQIHMARDADA